MEEKELQIVLTDSEYRFHEYCYEVYSPNGKYHPVDKKISDIHIIKYIRDYDFRLLGIRLEQGDVFKRIVLDTKNTMRYKMHIIDIIEKLNNHRFSNNLLRIQNNQIDECEVYEFASDGEHIKLANLPEFLTSDEYRKTFLTDIEENDAIDLLIKSVVRSQNA